MTNRRKEFKLLYNSHKMEDKEVLAYAESLEHVILNDHDITRDILTETQIKKLADAMDLKIIDMVDHNSSIYIDKIRHHDYADEELLKIMRKEPSAIKTPIACIGRHVYHVKSHFELIPQDLEIKGVVSKKGNSSERCP